MDLQLDLQVSELQRGQGHRGTPSKIRCETQLVETRKALPHPSLPWHTERESLQTPDEKEALNNIFNAINKSWNKPKIVLFSYHPQLEGQEARRH